MANKNLFKSKSPSPSSRKTVKNVPVANTVNAAGGRAYLRSDRQALAQIAATNTFNGTYYATAEQNLKLAQDAVARLKGDPEFIAKVAIYARDKGYMKDMPAFLCVSLAALDTTLFRKVFRAVVNNGKMLRNVIQIARSGQTGKTYNMSSGSFRHAIQEWFNNRSPESIFRAGVGNDPSMRDILRMAKPRPNTKAKDALFGYLAEKPLGEKERNLPDVVKQFENYKKTQKGKVPDVDFRYLDSLGLDKKAWCQVAENAGWTMTRMNLNTFARHGVFEDKKVTKLIADRLANPEEIRKAKAFPYQLLMAYLMTSNEEIPAVVSNALQDAMETAVENVPEFKGQIYICVDVSGSMKSAITGNRGSATSKVRCVDVASLYAATILRKNPKAVLLPFDERLHATHSINGRDSIMTNSEKLAKYGGGGTNCSIPLAHLNKTGEKGSAVIYISDNESWLDGGLQYYRGTGMATEWQKFSAKNPKAKLICIDIQATNNSQVKERENILQVGGFSDTVYDVTNSFLEYGHNPEHWVSVIESIDLDDE